MRMDTETKVEGQDQDHNPEGGDIVQVTVLS